MNDVQSIKCSVIGDGAIGKTTMINRLKTGYFSDEYDPTVFEFDSVKMKVEKIKVELQIWDSVAEEPETRILGFSDTDVFIIAYSSVDPSSLENIKTRWFKESQDYGPGKEKSVNILVATKIDLRKQQNIIEELKERDEKPVPIEDGEVLCKELEFSDFIECSSITGEGITEVFNSAASAVLKKRNETKNTNKNNSDSKCMIM